MLHFIQVPKFSNELINIPYKTDLKKRLVQYYGNVSAGFPSPAEDFVENKISLDEILLKHPESTYLVRVGGESMYPEYLIGDLLIVRSDIEPRHYDDVIVSVNNSEYTFKRYDAVNKRLISLNPKFKDCIQLQDDDVVIILGVVTDLVRNKRK